MYNSLLHECKALGVTKDQNAVTSSICYEVVALKIDNDVIWHGTSW